MPEESKGVIQPSPARLVRLGNMGLNPDILNDELKAKISLLDDDELAVLASIKAKLNNGLSARLKDGADTVGGFVW
jgi:hypothetical protein